MHEVFEHTADLGLRVRAASLAGLLEEAATGLFEIIAGDIAQIRPVTGRAFEVRGTDPAWLLLDWLGELHAAFEVERLLFREFKVTVNEMGLDAIALGEHYDPGTHRLAHEIKAITQHELAVTHTASGWEATLIVDI